MKKQIISFLLTVALVLSLMPMTAFAEDSKPEDAEWLVNTSDNHVWYKLSSGTLTIGGAGAMPDFNVLISSGVDNRPWSGEKDNISTVVIEPGVTCIGKSAFQGCSNLASVTIPSGVTVINSGAFSNCDKIAELHIDNIKSWCGITFKEQSSSPFASSSVNKTLYVGGEITTAITIPAEIKKINKYTFYMWSMLKNVTFENNSQLESIEMYAFYSCSGLESITIPSNVASISNNSFQKCSKIQSVTFENESKLKSIGIYAFSDCSSLESVIIPSSVTSIDGNVFNECSSLKSVTFENNSNISTISASTFRNCSSLENVILPSSVTNIKNQAFSGCSKLTELAVKAVIPPSMGGTPFTDTVTTFFVPNESVEAYKSNIYWKTKTIKGAYFVDTEIQGNGSVSVNSEYVDATDDTTNINVVIVPDEGYVLKSLCYYTTDPSVTTDIMASKSFTMPKANVTIKAEFGRITIADILPNDFPTDYTTGWVNDVNTIARVSINGECLCFDNKDGFNYSINLNETLTFEDNAYLYTSEFEDSYIDCCFVMDGETLSYIDLILGTNRYSGASGCYVESVTVTFDMKTHGIQVPDQVIPIGTTAIVPTDPTADGYVFEGWYDNSSCEGNAFDFDTTIDDDLTLFAKWRMLQIGDILPEDFPASSDSAWVSGNKKIYLNGADLNIEVDGVNEGSVAQKTDIITKNGSSYVYDPQYGPTLSFNMSEEDIPTLQSITITDDEVFNGMYTAPHIHCFTYTANGGVITATCSDGCDKGYDTDPLTLTLTESYYEYEGRAMTVDFIYGEPEAWTGAGLELPTITYAAKSGSSLTNDKAVDAGSYTASITVDTNKTASIDFEITKATPYIASNPAPIDINYGDKLSKSTLAGGYAQVSSTDSTEIPGQFTWTNPDTVPAIADSDSTEYSVTFTPVDENNYNTVSCQVKVTVNHDHNLVKVDGKAATEEAAGWKDYYECKDNEGTRGCGALFEDADGNTPIENLDAWKAQNGNGYLAPLVHTITPVSGQDATDIEAGFKPYYECKNCGKYYEDEKGKVEITDISAWKAQGGNGYIPSGNEIAAAKAAAKAALDAENAKDPLLNEIALTNGKSNIDKADTLADIESAKADAVKEIQSAQAAELAAVKDAAKKALDEEEAKDPLDDKTSLTNGKDGIDKAATKAAVASAKEEAVKAIQSAQAAELAAAKEAAKKSLDAENAKDPLLDDSSVVNGKSDIDSAATKAAVENAKKEAVAAIQEAQEVQPIEYKITEGNEAKIYLTALEDTLFTSDADFPKFVEVLVDGKVVDPKYYDAKSGSTDITLKKAYLRTLAEGEHTLTIASTDGEASTKFTILAQDPVPPTGDTTNAGLWAALSAVSLAALTACIIAIKKKKKA